MYLLCEYALSSASWLAEYQSRLEKNEICADLNLYTVKRDYTDRKQNSLRLKKGETIKAVKRLGNLWYGTKADGKEGWFGKECVEVPSKARSDWTIEDVYNFIWKDEVKAKGCSYFNVLEDKYTSEDEYTGTFLSHSWKIKLSTLNNILKAKFTGSKSKDNFVWLDAICINHLMVKSKTGLTQYQCWKLFCESNCAQAISRFDDYAFCLDTITSPAVLRENLALWQLYHYTSSHAKVPELNEFLSKPGKAEGVAMEPAEFSKLLENMLVSSGELISAKGIYTDKIYDRSPRSTTIRRLVGNSIGATEFNKILTDVFNRWMYAVAFNKLEWERKRKTGGWEVRAWLFSAVACKFALELGSEEKTVEYLKRIQALTKSIKSGKDKQAKEVVSSAANDLAGYFRGGKHYNIATELLQESLGMSAQANESAESPEGVRHMFDLALVYHQQGKYEEAEPILQDVLKAAKSTPMDKKEMSAVYHMLATTQFYLNKPEQGEKSSAKALALLEEKYADKKGDHPDVVLALFNLALFRLKYKMDKLHLVQRDVRKALLMRRRVRVDRVEVGSVVYELANEFVDIHRFREAEQLFAAALSIYRRKQKGQHDMMAVILLGMGKTKYQQRKLNDAERFMRESLQFLDKKYRKRDCQLHINTLLSLAGVLEELGRFEEAIKLYRRTVNMKRRLNYPETSLGISLNNLAILVAQQGNLVEAEKLYKESLAALMRDSTEDDSNLASIMHNLAGVLFSAGKVEDAEEMYRDALGMRIRLADDERNQAVVDSSEALATVLAARGEFEEAIGLFNTVVTIMSSIYGNDKHPKVRLVKDKLDLCKIHNVQRTLKPRSKQSTLHRS